VSRPVNVGVPHPMSRGVSAARERTSSSAETQSTISVDPSDGRSPASYRRWMLRSPRLHLGACVILGLGLFGCSASPSANVAFDASDDGRIHTLSDGAFDTASSGDGGADSATDEGAASETACACTHPGTSTVSLDCYCATEACPTYDALMAGLDCSKWLGQIEIFRLPDSIVVRFDDGYTGRHYQYDRVTHALLAAGSYDDVGFSCIGGALDERKPASADCTLVCTRSDGFVLPDSVCRGPSDAGIDGG
jgi:hypothetical protein